MNNNEISRYPIALILNSKNEITGVNFWKENFVSDKVSIILSIDEGEYNRIVHGNIALNKLFEELNNTYKEAIELLLDDNKEVKAA